MSWGQTEEDVEVVIDLPKGVRGRDISVIIEYNMVKFGLKKGFSFDETDEREKGQPITLLRRLLTGLLQPYRPIDPQLCTWSLDEGQLVITLTKRKPEYWSKLYK